MNETTAFDLMRQHVAVECARAAWRADAQKLFLLSSCLNHAGYDCRIAGQLLMPTVNLARQQHAVARVLAIELPSGGVASIRGSQGWAAIHADFLKRPGAASRVRQTSSTWQDLSVEHVDMLIQTQLRGIAPALLVKRVPTIVADFQTSVLDTKTPQHQFKSLSRQRF